MHPLSVNLRYKLMTNGTCYSSGDNFVDIYVSAEKRKFRVNTSFLCNKLVFFKSLSNGNFAGTESQTVTMNNTAELDFDVLVEWIYTAKLRTFDPAAPPAHNWSPVSLYQLAHTSSAKDLMDQIISLWLRYLRSKTNVPSVEEVAFVYRCLPLGSPLRRLVCWFAH